MKKIITILTVLVLVTHMAFSQSLMTINNPNYTPQQLVLNILITGCLQASNVVYTGSPQARGYFHYTGPASQFPFSYGIIMGSGNVSQAPGVPSYFASTSNGTSGYPLLNTQTTSTTYDAAVLEFDFIPADTVMNFQYVFASEEYPEWVGSAYNDVFAFFLTGPNPLGGSYTNVNIAIVPGTVSTPVSINNISPVTNSQYYVTCTGNVIVYDGRTVALNAHKKVTQCGNYHIKLAIADAGDSVYDSVVFLQGGSFISGDVVQMNPYNPVGDNHNYYEGCDGYYVFIRTDPTNTSVPIPILLNLSGTATNGVDYSTFPTSLTIPVGQVSDTIFFSTLMDNITEGTEYFIVTLLNGCPCTIGSTRDTIWIHDNVTMNAGITEPDTLICSTNPVPVTLHAYSNTPPAITHYHWNTNSFASTITVSPTVGAVNIYSVTVTDDCGQMNVANVTVTVSNMSTLMVTPTNLICYNICQGSVIVMPTAGQGFPPFTFAWLPAGTGTPSSGNATNLCAGNYLVSVTDVFGCLASSSFTLTQPPAIQLSFSSDSTTCPGASDGSLTVHVTNGVSPFTYSCTNVPIPVTVANSSYTFPNMYGGNYTINVTDANGCHASGLYYVGEQQILTSSNVPPLQCYGDNDGHATITVTGATPPINYSWSTGATGSNSVTGLSAGYYSCTVVDGHSCVEVVPITVTQPDSVTITSSQDTLMCLTQTATLTAQGFGGTPGYTYFWDGALSTQSINVSPTQTTTYTVYTEDSHGCRSVTTDVTVVLFPAVETYMYTFVDSICAGDITEIYINNSGGNGGPYTNHLGDSIVPSPFIVTPDVTTTYTIVSYDDCGSPSGTANITIHVMNAPGSNVTANINNGCVPVTVTFTDPSPDQGQTYFWNFGDNSDNGYSVARHPTHTYSDIGVFTVILTTQSTFGCISTVIFENMITVNPKPVADFIPTPQVTSIVDPVIFFENMSQNIINSNWLFGDGTNSDQTNIQHVFTDTGTYNVSLIVMNAEGCRDTLTQVVYVTDENTFWAPNAFDPRSKTGENTLFRILGNGIEPDSYHLIIYDRWGGKLYETYDMIHGWNGKVSSGAYAPGGSYNWVVIYKDMNGKNKQKSGTVTIID
ncbi:MAG: choice-of-anchor L domain-containing protein [Bacteroidia bacterium]|nr:choice-of-anchor L domain-containing protein [Bacteroidia bacterium]